MLLQQLDQVAELVLQQPHKVGYFGDQLDDLALDQRDQDDQQKAQAKQKHGQDREAGEAAPDTKRFEAADARRQNIGQREAGRERHQNALHEAQQQNDDEEQTEPEKSAVNPPAHAVTSARRRMRTQRHR